MILPVFGPIFICQLILISLILFILKLLLEHKLVESAIRSLEVWESGCDEDERPPAPKDIKVVSHRPLNSSRKQRILRATLNNFGSEAKVDFSLNKKLLGGVVITFGDEVIECSTRDRLEQSGMLKAK